MAFSNARAEYAVKFIESLKLNQGRFTGKNLELLPWQKDFLSTVYGTINEKGFRQYSTAYLEIPKKNGKSTLGSGIALYHTFADGEQRGEVYGCASDRAQASLIYDIAVDMVEQSKALKKRCKLTLSQKMLEDKITGSKYKVLSSEAYSKHGLNVSCCIFDELHSLPNRGLWDVMTAGAGDARDEPLWYVITTSGDDPDRLSIGWEVHEKARNIMNGITDAPTWFCRIWGLEPDFDGDIWDENLWYQVNPSLGHTIDIDKVRIAAQSAKANPAEEKNFRWLRLNQWVSLKTTGWLPLNLWDETESNWSIDELKGLKCYAGLDLSSTTDLTALCLIFPPQIGLDQWRSIWFVWIPEDNMKKRVRDDKVPYDRWHAEGLLHTTDGNVIDQDCIFDRIIECSKIYEIEALGSDKWNATQLLIDLEKEDMNVLEVPQTIAGMSAAMKFLEVLINKHELSHQQSALLRWCFGNITVVTDGNDNYKPKKVSKKNRMDPMVALINAFAVAIKLYEPVSVYETRGMRSV